MLADTARNLASVTHGKKAEMGGPGIGKSAMRVIVVGAGIGGLTTGIALAQAGIGVELLEQTARLGAVGAGVTLAPTTVPRIFRSARRIGTAVRSSARRSTCSRPSRRRSIRVI